jgi:hypothetical protein
MYSTVSPNLSVEQSRGNGLFVPENRDKVVTSFDCVLCQRDMVLQKMETLCAGMSRNGSST